MVGSAAGQAEVRVALPHRQVARTLLGVALGLAPTTRESVLTCECVCVSGDGKISEVRVLQVCVRVYAQARMNLHSELH